MLNDPYMIEELIDKMKKFLLKENKMCDFLESEQIMNKEKNIFKMSPDEINNTMDNVLKGTTPEKLSEELYGDKNAKENSNATDTNVATIEEDIKTMENIIKSYIEADECGLSNNDFKCEIQALSNILSDYKRVLKENEELKEKIDEINKINFPILY